MKSALRPILLNASLCASLCAFAFALSSCGEKQTDQQATAGGEILPGSASDAMLPFDTVRSQPPIAVSTEAGGEPENLAPTDAASDSPENPDAVASSAPAKAEAPSTPAAE